MFNFAPGIKVLAFEDPAEPSAVDRVSNKFRLLPEEYKKLVRSATEIEIELENKSYFRLWGPLGCLEMDEAYSISKHLPGAVPIGDNGGGYVVFYCDGAMGWGLYCNAYGNLDPNDSIWISRSLELLLGEQDGADRLP